MVGGLILLFSNRGCYAQVLSLELGSVAKDSTNLERQIKHDFKIGGTLVEAS